MAKKVILAIPAKEEAAEKREKLWVAAYCRVSTETDQQENSYEAQITYYRHYIDANPAWENAGIYADEGISGTSVRNREAFNRMIRDCEAGRIDMIITKSISRFSRNTLDCLDYIRRLAALHIPVLFEKEGIHTLDASGEVLLTILASISQQESKSISDNVRIGHSYNFKQGKGLLNTAWFLGYARGETPHSLVIDQAQAQVVRRIYRAFLAGFTPALIAGELNRAGIPTASGSGRYYASTINSILRNEKYCGDLLMQKYYTPDFLTHKVVRNTGQRPQYYVRDAHAPIVPRVIFERVRTELSRRRRQQSEADKRRPARLQALSGRVVCAGCGGLLYRFSRKDGRGVTWQCPADHASTLSSTQSSTLSSCGCFSVGEAKLQAAVLTAFNDLPKRRDELERAFLRYRERTHLLDSLRADQQAQIEALEVVLEQYVGEMGEDCTEALETEAQLDVLENELAALERLQEEPAWREMQTRFLLELIGQMQAGVHHAGCRAVCSAPETITEEAPANEADPACRDEEDFYARTRYRVPDGILDARGQMVRFCDDLAARFLEHIVVLPGGYRVTFKGGEHTQIEIREGADGGAAV